MEPLTLQELITRFEHHRRAKGFSEHTIERVSLTMRRICRDMELTTLDSLTTDVVLEWGDLRRTGELGKVLSQSGLYAAFNSVRSFIRFLDDSDVPHQVNKKLIWCNPRYERIVLLRPEEIRKIVTFAPYDIGLLIRLLYTGGMRLGEALDLTVDDLRHDNTIYVTGKWATSRTVVITAELRQELIWASKDRSYLFSSLKDPAEPMKRKNAYYFIKAAMVKAGYPNAYPHSLRHGFATSMLRAGANTSQVQRLLGHTNISTTQRYEHLVTEDLVAAHKQFLIKV